MHLTKSFASIVETSHLLLRKLTLYDQTTTYYVIRKIYEQIFQFYINCQGLRLSYGQAPTPALHFKAYELPDHSKREQLKRFTFAPLLFGKEVF